MRVGVAGATGFIGRLLCEALSGRGDEVVAFTRKRQSSSAGKLALLPGVSVVEWDAHTVGGALLDAIAGCDAVVNLAGEPIAGRRWSSAIKRRIRESRTLSTRALADAMARSQRPRVLLNGSGIGYYGSRGDEVLDERSAPGDDFLARVCLDWEAEARRAEEHGTRVVRLRTGIVLGEGGGALEKMALPFRFFAGGPIGAGRQWMSWIHLDDLVGIILFGLDRDDVTGALNGVSPSPVRQRELAAALGRAMRRPSWIPVPPLALRAAFGESADTLTASLRVVPAAALSAGFQFAHADLDEALSSVLG